jgi:hypothetical protein
LKITKAFLEVTPAAMHLLDHALLSVIVTEIIRKKSKVDYDPAYLAGAALN